MQQTNFYSTTFYMYMHMYLLYLHALVQYMYLPYTSNLFSTNMVERQRERERERESNFMYMYDKFSYESHISCIVHECVLYVCKSTLDVFCVRNSLGQFETYLFQKGEAKVIESIKKCWCSCFSERVMSHRLDCGLPTTGLKMAVVIQVNQSLM